MDVIEKKAAKRSALASELENLRARLSAAMAREAQSDEPLRGLRAAVKLADGPEEAAAAKRALEGALAAAAAAVKETNELRREVTAAEDALAQLGQEIELAERRAAEELRQRALAAALRRVADYRRAVLDGLVGLVLYRQLMYGPAAVAPASIVEAEIGLGAHPERLLALADELKKRILNEEEA